MNGFSAVPLVSVLMPAFNCAQFIGAAIQSIVAQSFKNFELVIVDDGSTDGTEDVVQCYQDRRIRFLRNRRNIGIAASRNLLIEDSRGSYIAWLDADDVSAPNRIERQLEFLETNQSYGLCCSNYITIDAKGVVGVRRAWDRSDVPLRWLLLWQNPIAQSSVMIRRKVIEACSLRYDTMFPPSEDYEFWTRLARHSDLYRLNDVLLQYRLLESSAFHSNRQKALVMSREASKRYAQFYKPNVPGFHELCTYFSDGPSEEEWKVTDARKLIDWIEELANVYCVKTEARPNVGEMVTRDCRRITKDALARIEKSHRERGRRWLKIRDDPGLFALLWYERGHDLLLKRVKKAVRSILRSLSICGRGAKSR